MTGIKDKFTSFVNIGNGTQSHILGDGVVQDTLSLNLKNCYMFQNFL